MKTIVAACVCVQLSLAGSNLVTTSTGVGTVSIQAVPVSPATYIALQVAYDHFHVQDGDSAQFVSMGPTVSNQMFGFRRSGTSIQCHDNLDSGFNGIPSVDVSGWEAEAEDNGFSARCERDPVAKVLILTVCRMDGSHCGRSSAAVDQFGSGTIAAMSIGRSGWGPGVNGLYGDIALIRVSTTPYSLDVPPNAQNAPPGNVADFEFDRSSVDSVSGASWHFQSANPGSDVYTDAEVYTDRRVYSPVCSAGDTKIFQAGVTNSLSAERSFSLDGKGAPSFQWNQTGGPAKLQFASGRNSQKPSLTVGVPGQYDYDLVVTDQSGQSSKCSVTHAAVQTDSHDVIIVQSPFAEIGSLVGPVLRFGASP